MCDCIKDITQQQEDMNFKFLHVHVPERSDIEFFLHPKFVLSTLTAV